MSEPPHQGSSGSRPREDAFDKALRTNMLRDFDLDAFADGITAHREGRAFHENPHGRAEVQSLARLSWSYGWNERAIAYG
jgi:hypothetical protein